MERAVIEKRAVLAVDTMILEHSEEFQAKIETEDKLPLIDGHIFRYLKNKGYTIKSYEGAIPIQVKGTTQKKVFNYEKFYGFRTEYLKAFQKEGGVLLFVVYIDPEDGNETMFYQSLDVLRLRELIDEKKKQCAVPLVKFPADKDAQRRVLQQAFNDLNHVMPSEESLNEIPQQIQIPSILMNDLLSLPKNRSIVAYQIVHGMEVPYMLIYREMVSRLEHYPNAQDILFPGSWTKKVSVTRLLGFQKKVVEIKFGRESKITMQYTAPQKLKIKCEKCSTVEDELENLNVFENLLRHNQIKVHGILSNIFSQNMDFSKIYNEIIMRRSYLQNLKLTSDKFGIQGYSKKDLNNEESAIIQKLLDFCDSTKVLSSTDMITFSFSFKGKRYLLFGTNEDIWDCFDINTKKVVIMGADSKKEEISPEKNIVNPYLVYLMDNHPASTFPNYNFSKIEKWYLENSDKLKLNMMIRQLNDYLRNLQISYRESQNSEYLMQAREIATLFLRYQDNEFLRLCRFYLNSELKVETDLDELEVIMKLRTSKDEFIQAYAQYVLGAKTKANNIFIKMNSENKRSWEKYVLLK